MGKKASFKPDLSYEDDLQVYSNNEWEDDADNDEGERYVCSHLAAPRYVASRNAKMGVGGAASNSNRKTANGQLCNAATKGSLSVLSPLTVPRYYNRDSRIRLTILDANSLLHVSTYLDLRSVAAMCCTGKFVDDLLASDFLYCKKNGHGNNSGHNMMLPCVRKLTNILPLETSNGETARPRGLARTFAHESDRIFGSHQQRDTATSIASRNRNFAVAGHYRCKSEVENVHIFGNAVALITKSCEIEIHWVKTSLGSPGPQKPTPTKCLTPPSCDLLLGSAFHAEKNTFALLSTVSKGSRYLLSLLRLPTHRGDGPELISQCKLPPSNLYSSSSAKPIVEFNLAGSKILLGTTERCFVADTSMETSVMFSPKQRQFTSLTLHGKYLFGVCGRTVLIYDTTKDEIPIASGKTSSENEKPESIFLFGGRIWMVCRDQLICTPRLLHNLNKLSGNERRMNFSLKTAHSYRLLHPCTSCIVLKKENLLYFSNGRHIRIFDRRDVSSFSGATTETPITSMAADDTKLVCATKHPNRCSGRVEIFPIDTATRSVFQSVFVKKTFLSHHTMENIQLRGRLLSVSYSYDAEGGEVQIFDLLQDLNRR